MKTIENVKASDLTVGTPIRLDSPWQDEHWGWIAEIEPSGSDHLWLIGTAETGANPGAPFRRLVKRDALIRVATNIRKNPAP